MGFKTFQFVICNWNSLISAMYSIFKANNLNTISSRNNGQGNVVLFLSKVDMVLTLETLDRSFYK